jgi:hypothetical protein
MMAGFNTSYYVMDYVANIIFLLNDNYGYMNKKSFSKPTYILTIGSSLYITGDNDIWKTDESLNVLRKYSSQSSAQYRVMYFNCTENEIYVSSQQYKYIQVFHLNLTLKYNISTSSYNSRSFSEYNNQLYVGTIQSIVLVIVNKEIIRKFTVCLGMDYVTSIVSDNFGLMAFSCYSNNSVKLYFSNGTFTSKSLTSSAGLNYACFDSKGQFVLISQTQINIYN